MVWVRVNQDYIKHSLLPAVMAWWFRVSVGVLKICLTCGKVTGVIVKWSYTTQLGLHGRSSNYCLQQGNRSSGVTILNSYRQAGPVPISPDVHRGATSGLPPGPPAGIIGNESRQTGIPEYRGTEWVLDRLRVTDYWAPGRHLWPNDQHAARPRTKKRVTVPCFLFSRAARRIHC